MYVPINVEIYNLAYSGMIAGVTGGRPANSVVSYAATIAAADAFAQKFDTTWNSATALRAAECNTINSIVTEYWRDRPAQSPTPSFYTNAVVAIIEIVTEANTFITANVPTADVLCNAAPGSASPYVIDNADATEPANIKRDPLLTPFPLTIDNTQNGMTAHGSATVVTASMSGSYSTVGGGDQNTVTGGSSHSTVGGGLQNTITSPTGAVIGGGQVNGIAGAAATSTTIGGGESNQINNTPSATIGGGADNTINPPGASGTIAGGDNNIVDGGQATVGGGTTNTASGSGSTVGGGNTNGATGIRSTVSGGGTNAVTAQGGVIGGGDGNSVLANYGTIPGGSSNAVDAVGGVATGTQGFAHAPAQQSHGAGIIAGGGGTMIARDESNYVGGVTPGAVPNESVILQCMGALQEYFPPVDCSITYRITWTAVRADGVLAAGGTTMLLCRTPAGVVNIVGQSQPGDEQFADAGAALWTMTASDPGTGALRLTFATGVGITSQCRIAAKFESISVARS